MNQKLPSSQETSDVKIDVRSFSSPDWYLRDVDLRTLDAQMVPMSRETYRQTSFLDSRTVTLDGRVFHVSLPKLTQAAKDIGLGHRRVNYVFHSAFCGSTLMSRCLDLPGQSFSYREPSVIHRYAWYSRQPHRLAENFVDRAIGDQILDVSLRFLSRTYEAGETPLIKPSDACNNLVEPLLSFDPGSKALLMYSRIEDFLVAVLKGPGRRQFIRECLGRARFDAARLDKLSGINPDQLSDACAAAYVWIVQLTLFRDLLRSGPERIRSLHSAELFSNPADVLESVGAFFGVEIAHEQASHVATQVLARDSKFPGKPFDRTSYEAKQQELSRQFADEIKAGIEWASNVTDDDPIPGTLPCSVV